MELIGEGLKKDAKKTIKVENVFVKQKRELDFGID